MVKGTANDNRTKGLNKTEGTREDTSAQEISSEFLYTIVTLNLAVGITTILLNTLVCMFYRKKKRSTAALLYIYMTSWDIFMGVSAVVQAAYLFVRVTWDVTAHEEVLRGIICGVYVWTGVAVRSSVYANTVLSVVRTINISQPFYRVRRRKVHIINLVFLALLLLVTIIDVWYNIGSDRPRPPIGKFELNMIVNPSMGYSLVNFEGEERAGLLEKAGVSNSFFQVATLVALICLAVQCKVLLCSPNRPTRQRTLAASRTYTYRETSIATYQDSGDKGPKSKSLSMGEPSTELESGESLFTKKTPVLGEISAESEPSQPVTSQTGKECKDSSSDMRTTMTIAQLTMVFCLCNLAYTAAVIWLADDIKRKGRKSGDEPRDRQIFYVTSTFIPFLNSMINPLILIIRSKSVRNSISSMFIS